MVDSLDSGLRRNDVFWNYASTSEVTMSYFCVTADYIRNSGAIGNFFKLSGNDGFGGGCRKTYGAMRKLFDALRGKDSNEA